MARPIITLTTDFGLNDHFVGTVKGAILSIAPDAEIVDICHSVQAFDILDGALALAQAYSYFPTRTVHLVVIDPGVGSARRPILASSDKYNFVAPDNGVLSLMYAREERLNVRHITSDHYFLQPLSNTFHGRDIFAPVAGYLAKGVDQEKFGPEITDFVRFNAPRPKAVDAKTLRGIVLKVDRFGNLITNLHIDEFPEVTTRTFGMNVGLQTITRMASTFSECPPGELFVMVGSSGYLEVAVNEGSAAKVLGCASGSPVELTFLPTP